VERNPSPCDYIARLQSSGHERLQLATRGIARNVVQ
jgi:hypothetical protein